MTSTNNQESFMNILKNNDKGKNSILMAYDCPITLNLSHPLNRLISIKLSVMQNMSPEEVAYMSYTFSNRLKTYGGWEIDFLTPRRMAEAGFYYMGRQDRVKCLYCSLEMHNFKPGDDPLFQHKRRSPKCAFFHEKSEGYDVCGIYESDDFGPKEYDNNTDVENFLNALGIVQKIEGSQNNEYASYENRLETFKNNCLIHLKHDIHSLCEAGFFYSGDGLNDLMKCFYCNKELQNWEDNDEPWVEHARWSPTCSYVLLSKGKNFVEKVLASNLRIVRDVVPKINQEELSMLNEGGNANSSMLENIIVDSVTSKIDHIKTTENNQMKTSLPELKLDLSQQNRNAIPDSMLCKICCKDVLSVAFLPCCHVIACIQCSLRMDYCGVCRKYFSLGIRIHLYQDNSKDEDRNQLPCSSSQSFDKSSDKMICKICNNDEIGALFIPCKHVCSCINCATKMDHCPCCSESICGTIQLYL